MHIKKYNYPKNFTENEIADISNAIINTIIEGTTILSEEVVKFEKEFAEYLNVEYVLGCNSGTDALYLALKTIDVQPNDEVIIPANTFYATAAAVKLAGAKLVLCDVDKDSYLMTAQEVKRVITDKTKAVIAVHLYGNVCDVDEISELCKNNKLYFIEDCAQAHGAKWNGIKVGTKSDIGCFSFHPSKNLPAAGDAGAISTNDFNFAKKIKMLRHLGQSEQNCHNVIGINSKLDAIQSIVLSKGLKKLDEWNSKRRTNAQRYRQGLTGLPLLMQKEGQSAQHVYHLFQIKTQNKEREALLKYLLAMGVDAVVRYPNPIHKQAAFRDEQLNIIGLPIAEDLCDSLICLPIHPHLTEDEINYVITKITEFYNDNYTGLRQ